MVVDQKEALTAEEVKTKLKAILYDRKQSLGSYCEENGLPAPTVYAWLNGYGTIKHPPISLLNLLGYKELVVYIRKEGA